MRSVFRAIASAAVAASVSQAGCAFFFHPVPGPGHAGWGSAPALHRAAYRGDVETVKRELERGADPDQVVSIPWLIPEGILGRMEERPWSPLSLAVIGRRAETAQALIASGAHPDARAMGEAIRGDMYHSPEERASALMVPMLLAGGADPNSEDPDKSLGQRMLHEAATVGNPRVVQALLDAHADPLARDDFGETPLHAAASARQDHVSTVQVLLRAGVPAGVATPEGVTPLHKAAAAGNNAIVAVLLWAGAPVDARVHGVPGVAKWMDGCTPLLVALSDYGNPETVRLLLDAGADPTARRADGTSVLDLARMNADRARDHSKKQLGGDRSPEAANEVLDLVNCALAVKG